MTIMLGATKEPAVRTARKVTMSRLPPPPLHPSISSKATAKSPTPERRLPPPVHPANPRNPSPGVEEGRLYSDPPTPSIEETNTKVEISSEPPPIPPRTRVPDTATSASAHEDPPTPAIHPSEVQEPPLHPASLISRPQTPAEDAELPESSSIPGALVLDVNSTSILTAAQEDAIRQQLEDDEINWYLESFGKHVQHLRVATKALPDTSAPPMQKPELKDYTFDAVASRLKAFKDEQAEEAEGSETASLHGLSGDKEPELMEAPTNQSVAWSDVDLWAYAAAYARYIFGPPTPSQPHEPFSIPRLKSNAERLYVVAVPAWQMIMTEIGDLCLWKHTTRTIVAIMFYAAQIITSSFLSTSCILILYKLLKTRFFPPSPLSLYKAALEARQRLQEAEALTDEVTGYDQVDDEPASSSSGGLGIGIDLSKAKKGLGIAGEAIDFEGKDGKGKKHKRKMMKKLKELEAELGPGAVVVLGDIADVHEKVKNLFMWRSPASSTRFAILLAVSAVLSHVTPVWILVKLVQVALGVVVFVVVPMIAAQERYEPSAWLIGSAPTDSEYAMHLIRKRAAAGKPIVHDKRLSKPSRQMSSTPSILSSITDPSVSEVVLVDPTDSSATKAPKNKGFSWNKVLAVGERGSQLLESSRQYATGEKGVELKLAKPGETLQSSGILTQMKLGSGGPGLILTRKEGSTAGGQASDAVSYLAQYRARPGSLSISTTSIHFKPFIASKETAATSDGVAPSKAAKEKEIIIPMEDVVGIKKRDKTTFLVVVSAGLEIECKDGRSVRFAFVANRDQAFNRLVASSHQAFAKV